MKTTLALIAAMTLLQGCGEDKKKKGPAPSPTSLDHQVQRRSLAQALNELEPLTKRFAELDHSEHLLVQDLSADILVGLQNSTPEQRMRAKVLTKEAADSAQDSMIERSIDSLGADRASPKKSLARTDRELGLPASDRDELDFTFVLPPKKALVVPSFSYCLDGNLDSPHQNIAFTATAPSEEPNLRLIIGHHEATRGDLGYYQSVIWEVEETDRPWRSASDGLKQVLSDFEIPQPEGDVTLSQVSELPAIKAFVEQNKLAGERLPGVDLTWRALSGYSRGNLSIYNSTSEPIEVKPWALVTRFRADHRVNASNFSRTSLTQLTTDSPSSVSGLRGSNSCEDPDENQPPEVQDIWAGRPDVENMSGQSLRAVANITRMAQIVSDLYEETEPGDDTSEHIDRLAIGADLLASGATVAADDLIQDVEAKATMGDFEEDSVITRVLAIDLSTGTLELDELLDLALWISAHKTSARRIADALARTRDVSPANYKLILSLEGIRATVAQIEMLRVKLKEAIAATEGEAVERSLSRLAGSDVDVSADSNRTTITVNGRNISYFRPELITVLKHPSLIFDIGSMWRIQREAHKKSQEAAGCATEPSLEDGYYDAYRHAYWSAMMAIDHGTCKSEWVGSGHEENIVGGNDPAKKEMDLHNNQLGRDVADELRESLQRDPTREELSQEISRRLDSGKGKIIDPASGIEPSAPYTSICGNP